MKKVSIVFLLLMTSVVISCKKKKEEVTPDTNATNVAPLVIMTSPANNGSVNIGSGAAKINAPVIAGTNIQLSASAFDTDGSIIKVEFYDYDVLLGTSTTAPYSLSSFTQVGDHDFKAKAYDNSGATTASSVVNFSVTQSPIIVVGI